MRHILVYSWHEIEQMICEQLGIEQQYFRNYHKLVGGSYKDFWHVALETIIPDNMTNDSIIEMFYIEDYDEFKDEYDASLRDSALYGEWAIPIYSAYNNVIRNLSPDTGSIYVEFSW